MKQTFGRASKAHGDEKLQSEPSKPAKGWYALRKARLLDKEAFAEIEDELGPDYARQFAMVVRATPARRSMGR